MGYSLAGRNALITGASQGLGLAIARAYVKAGAAVLLCARDTEMLDEARRQLVCLASPGQMVSAQAADVSSPEDVNRLLGVATSTFSSFQILVNNAGVYGPKGTIEEVREHRIDVNSIAPGPLNTRLLDEVLAAGPEKVGRNFYERSVKQKEQGGAPLEKGADLAVFLASSASDGITGKLLSAVWDPWEALPEHLEELQKTDIYTLRRIVPKDRGYDWG